MQFSTIGLAVIFILLAVCCVLWGYNLKEHKRRRFKHVFCEAFGFSPNLERYSRAEENKVRIKLESVAYKLAAVRYDLQQYILEPGEDDLMIHSIDKGLRKNRLIKGTAKECASIESEYVHLQALARKAGYPQTLLDRVHGRFFVLVDDDAPVPTAS